MSGLTERHLINFGASIARSVIDIVCQPYQLNAKQKLGLISVMCKGALSSLMFENRSGFVVAGYGAKDYFPHVISYHTDGFIGRKLRIDIVRQVKISSGNASIIAPFAQTEAAELFIEGIDPSYNEYIEESITDIFAGLAPIAAKYFDVSGNSKISKFRNVLKSKAGDYINACEAKRRREFIMPVLNAVQALDKSEMAALAENLVSLTALKQKVSLELETVGGPIDVAFISKYDGFIWIKRKHYFSSDLNPFFLQRYLQADRNSDWLT